MKDISSTGSFIDFTLENFIYVDKTEYIPKLVKLKRVFISRPRRFGKSLTLDTIATLFETGVEPYFKGTWIYDKWTEPTYPVFRLSFLNLDNSSMDLFKKQLNSKITEFANKISVKGYVEKTEPEDSILSLLEKLEEETRQIVILIDEYDYQLTSNINNDELYKQFQQKIKRIYANIKDKFAIKFLGIMETHVFNQQTEARKWMDKYGCRIESWGPFAEGKNNLFSNPVLTDIGGKYGKTAAQVALRFLLQKGIAVIPKSVHAERMRENIDVFDFRLSEGDMGEIEKLDTGTSLFVDHSAPETSEMFNRWEI